MQIDRWQMLVLGSMLVMIHLFVVVKAWYMGFESGHRKGRVDGEVSSLLKLGLKQPPK